MRWTQSCRSGRDVVPSTVAHRGSSQSLSVLTATAWEECQGHAWKDSSPVAVFSVCSFVADLSGVVRVRKGEAVNLPSWQPNGYTLQSHIEMTLIEQII